MIDFEKLEEEYEDEPMREKMNPVQRPINSHADMLKRVESRRNRLRKLNE